MKGDFNKHIIVDPEDQWIVDMLSWWRKASQTTIYARGHVPKGGGKKMYIHHCIVGLPLNGLMVDHKNGNGLDNRRCNLRIVSNSVNQKNLTKFREDYSI